MGGERFNFCRENFLGIKTIQTIAGLKRQLLELLSGAGFVRYGLNSRAVEGIGRRTDGTDGVRLALENGVNGSFRRGEGGGGRSLSELAGGGDRMTGDEHYDRMERVRASGDLIMQKAPLLKVTDDG